MAFNYDSKCYPYPSQKTSVFGRNGMVSTSTPLAAQAGLDILKKGGNAVDAAIATMICTTVVEPTMNAIGSDNFAIIWFKDKIYGLNSSGPSAKGLSIEKLKNLGYESMPTLGWHAVNVPGAPAGWKAMHERFGSLPFKDLFETAIKYAEEGFPVTPQVTTDWESNLNLFKASMQGPANTGKPMVGLDEFQAKPFFDYFAPNGKAPKPGDIYANKDMAETLKRLRDSECEDMYKGKTADMIVDFAQKCGAFMDHEDLASYKPEWVEPISVNYRGYDVYEIPPNGNGISLLMALNILKGFDLPVNEKECARTYHLLFESMKLAYMDSMTYVTDAKEMKVRVEDMISEEYAAQRRKLIKLDEAIMPTAGKPDQGGTVYCATADKDGNMVSFIQSNFNLFGSGIVFHRRQRINSIPFYQISHRFSVPFNIIGILILIHFLYRFNRILGCGFQCFIYGR